MGAIYKAKCRECNYVSRNLFCGGGMDTESWFQPVNKFPVYDPAMRGIKVENLYLRDFILACDPELKYYNDESMRHPEDKPLDPSESSDYPDLLEGRFFCPSCLKYTMVFFKAGHWG